MEGKLVEGGGVVVAGCVMGPAVSPFVRHVKCG